MEKRVVIVKDELKNRLEKVKEKVNKSLYDLGFTEYNISQLEEEKNTFVSRSKALKEELDLTLKEQADILESIEKEYGSGELNLDTFDLTLDY